MLLATMARRFVQVAEEGNVEARVSLWIFKAASALHWLLIGLPALFHQAPEEAAKAMATDLPLHHGLE